MADYERYPTAFRPNDHRRGKGGRPNPLDDDKFAQAVADAFFNGCTRREMCDMFGVKDPNTISRWRRHPKVKRMVLKAAEDRVIQITRKVDGKIEAILEQADDLDVKDLLAIRKEFLGGALRAQAEKADEETIGAAQDWMDSNPELAEALTRSMEKATGVTVEIDE